MPEAFWLALFGLFAANATISTRTSVPVPSCLFVSLMQLLMRAAFQRQDECVVDLVKLAGLACMNGANKAGHLLPSFNAVGDQFFEDRAHLSFNAGFFLRRLL
jgi:hypothetical protein